MTRMRSGAKEAGTLLWSYKRKEAITEHERAKRHYGTREKY